MVRHGDAGRLSPASGAALGIATTAMSVLVLLPLAAVLAEAAGGGWSGFWGAVATPEASAALRLSIGVSLLATSVNAVMGTLLAWVLVRDDFVGKGFLELVIDLPFALPTIVAGVVLVSLYGPRSPIGLDLAQARTGVFVALLFVTLPFMVRSVQPVLLGLDPEVEEAAASLGATRTATFRRVVLPNLAPAIAAGSALSFARAIGEYGAVILISGNIPRQTQVASVEILGQLENDNRAGAAAVAAVLLVAALAVMVAIDGLRRWAAHRG